MKRDIAGMTDKELVAYGIELYESDMPVAEVLELTGLTRTRLYNNLSKQGKSPNRQVSNVKAEADREIDFYKEQANEAREEIGALKYQIQRLQELVEELEDASQPKKGISKEDWFNRLVMIKTVAAPQPKSLVWSPDRSRASNK